MYRKIKGYEILRQIGTGGFGEVFVAKQEVINREVAIKVILPNYANRLDFIQRFQLEAEIVAKLEHPHIVPLYDYWREPDGAYLVMRYIKGGSLGDKLLTDGAYSIESAAKLLEQIAGALYVAHRSKVVHQDIKPANILLDEDGNAYLTDFGIARDIESNINLAEDSGTMHGSPKYISPEHLRRKEITHRSDIYSLGLLMYEVLTGRPAYDGNDLMEILQQHVRNPLPTLQEKAPHLPAELNQPLMQAAVKDPMSRYENVLQFAEDFTRIVRQIQNPNVTATIPIPAGAFSDAEATGRIDLETRNPFKGLLAFQESDAGDFFGRDESIKTLTKRMIEKSQYSRFLAVIGPSGSGKSSLVLAGLLPALKKGEIMGIDTSFSSAMTPSNSPMRQLEGAILKIANKASVELMENLSKDFYDLNKMLNIALPANSEFFLVIDQFEEVFTLVSDEELRRNFLNVLYNALSAENSRLRLIITLRADFLDRPLQYTGWGEMISLRNEIVSPLRQEQVRKVIEAPAKEGNLILEAGLVDRIVQDMSKQAGALPLLQYTLSELYDKRLVNLLTHQAYDEMGGISGALAKRADEIFAILNEAQQHAAQIIFPRLLRLGQQSRTRRRVLLGEIYSLRSGDSSIREMVEIFGKYRLLTFDYDTETRFPTIEIAHEALISSWERLENWLTENEGALILQERLAHDARLWAENEKDSSYLATGTRLAQFRELENHPIIALSKRENEFLDASIREENALLAKELQRQRMIAGLAVLASFAALIAIIFWFNANQARNAESLARDQEAIARQVAEENARIARSRELAASSILNTSNAPDTALLLALEAIAVEDSFEGRNALLSSLSANLNLEAFYNGHQETLRAVAVSSDGETLAAGSRNGLVILWNRNTHEEILRLSGHEAQINALTFSPDNAWLVSSDNAGRVIIWDSLSGEILQQFELGNPVRAIAFSPDGAIFALGTGEGQIQAWSTEDYAELFSATGHGGLIYSLVFSPDNSRFATGGSDGKILLWDIEGNAVLEIIAHEDDVTRLAFSPDGRSLASASIDSSVRVWNVSDGSNLWAFINHRREISALTFSDDGRYIISGDLEAFIVFWDASTGGVVNSFYNIGRNEVRDFADYGNRLFIAGDNTSLVEMSIGVEPRFGQVLTRNAEELLAIDNSSNAIAYAGGNTDFRVYIKEGDEEAIALEFHTAPVTALEFSELGLISVGADGQAALWQENSVTASLQVQDGLFSLATYGDMLALGTNRGEVNLYRYQNAEWEELASLTGHTNRVSDLAFSPDGSRLVSASRDGSLIIWDIANQVEFFRLEGHTDAVQTVAYSSDGSLIASGSRDLTIRLWNAETGEAYLTPLTGHENWVMALEFSPNGRILASASTDRSILLWSIPEGRRFESPFFGHSNWVNNLSFAPDGETLYSVGQDGFVFEWQTDLAAWEATACEIVNRPLNEDELREYFGTLFEPQHDCE